MSIIEGANSARGQCVVRGGDTYPFHEIPPRKEEPYGTGKDYLAQRIFKKSTMRNYLASLFASKKYFAPLTFGGPISTDFFDFGNSDSKTRIRPAFNIS